MECRGGREGQVRGGRALIGPAQVSIRGQWRANVGRSWGSVIHFPHPPPQTPACLAGYTTSARETSSPRGLNTASRAPRTGHLPPLALPIQNLALQPTCTAKPPILIQILLQRLPHLLRLRRSCSLNMYLPRPALAADKLPSKTYRR